MYDKNYLNLRRIIIKLRLNGTVLFLRFLLSFYGNKAIIFYFKQKKNPVNIFIPLRYLVLNKQSFPKKTKIHFSFIPLDLVQYKQIFWYYLFFTIRRITYVSKIWRKSEMLIENTLLLNFKLQTLGYKKLIMFIVLVGHIFNVSEKILFGLWLESIPENRAMKLTKKLH